MLLIPSIPLHNAAKHTWEDKMYHPSTRMYLLLKYADSACRTEKVWNFRKRQILIGESKKEFAYSLRSVESSKKKKKEVTEPLIKEKYKILCNFENSTLFPADILSQHVRKQACLLAGGEGRIKLLTTAMHVIAAGIGFPRNMHKEEGL